MTCEACAGIQAWNDRLQRELEDKVRYEQRLMERTAKAEARVEHLERELREALDESRLRRAATGYLPALDNPEG